MQRVKGLCRDCRKELQEGWKVCPFCSTPLVSSAVEDESVNPALSPLAAPLVSPLVRELTFKQRLIYYLVIAALLFLSLSFVLVAGERLGSLGFGIYFITAILVIVVCSTVLHSHFIHKNNIAAGHGEPDIV